MERLSGLILKSVQNGLWEPITLTRGGTKLTHMFFADDLVLFGYATVQHAARINEVLNNFCSLSGQEINRDKSRIFFSKNVKRDRSGEVCEVLGMQPTQNLGRYLGVPLIHGRNSKGLYQYLIERLEQKLAGWKVGSLSMAGRVSLAISTLNSLPTYAMQTTLLPMEICEVIDRKIRSFIWGAKDGERKIHLINWDHVCSPKSHGGLGLRSARELNKAFLMKLNWGMMKNPNELWVKVLTTKYLRKTVGGLVLRKSNRRSSCWRGMNEAWDTFRGGLSWGIRNGKSTNFWKERWLDNGCVIGEQVTPPLNQENWVVADYCLTEGGWNLQVLAAVLPQQLLQAVIGMTSPSSDLENDTPVWGLEANGCYSVKSGYALAKGLPLEADDRLWNKIWKLEGCQRIRQFLWLAANDRLLTNAERQRRHIANNADCGLCIGLMETTEHILRGCPLARQVWEKALDLRGDDPFFSLAMKDWWTSNLNNRLTATRFSTLCWLLWKSRNERIFEGKRAEAKSIVERGRFWESVSTTAFAELRQLRTDGRGKIDVEVGWNAAKSPMVTLNTDGSVLRNTGGAAAGGVLRDWQGRTIDAFASNLGSCSITRAEITGVIVGMERAWHWGIRNLEVQTDSRSAVTILEQTSQLDHQHAALVLQYRRLMERNWLVTITHIFREANHLADALVNKGHGVSLGTHTIGCEDHEVIYWERYDLLGGTEIRRVAV
ncbi:Putative ribonuclease H protein At1g65750 [Linum perenne]